MTILVSPDLQRHIDLITVLNGLATSSPHCDFEAWKPVLMELLDFTRSPDGPSVGGISIDMSPSISAMAANSLARRLDRQELAGLLARDDLPQRRRIHEEIRRRDIALTEVYPPESPHLRPRVYPMAPHPARNREPPPPLTDADANQLSARVLDSTASLEARESALGALEDERPGQAADTCAALLLTPDPPARLLWDAAFCLRNIGEAHHADAARSLLSEDLASRYPDQPERWEIEVRRFLTDLLARAGSSSPEITAHEP